MQESKMIYGKIPLIISEIDVVRKKKNPNTNITYAYRGIDDFMNVLNPLLAKHKLIIVPYVMKNTREIFKTSSGKDMVSVVMEIKYTVYAEDGSYIESLLIGEGFDSGDKASNKAQAIALKYLIMQLFMVPTEDISDPDDEDPNNPNDPKEPPKAGSNKPVTNNKQANAVSQNIDSDLTKQTKGVRIVTESQLKRLDYIKNTHNWSYEEVTKYVRNKYGTDVNKLNMNQYDELCKYIEGSSNGSL